MTAAAQVSSQAKPTSSGEVLGPVCAFLHVVDVYRPLASTDISAASRYMPGRRIGRCELLTDPPDDRTTRQNDSAFRTTTISLFVVVPLPVLLLLVELGHLLIHFPLEVFHPVPVRLATVQIFPQHCDTFSFLESLFGYRINVDSRLATAGRTTTGGSNSTGAGGRVRRRPRGTGIILVEYPWRPGGGGVVVVDLVLVDGISGVPEHRVGYW